MGLSRIVRELDFRRAGELSHISVRRSFSITRFWRGWSKYDLESLRGKLDNPGAWSDGMLKLTRHEYLALQELNSQNTARNPRAKTSPLLVWIKNQGLVSAIRKH